MNGNKATHANCILFSFHFTRQSDESFINFSKDWTGRTQNYIPDLANVLFHCNNTVTDVKD